MVVQVLLMMYGMLNKLRCQPAFAAKIAASPRFYLDILLDSLEPIGD